MNAAVMVCDQECNLAGSYRFARASRCFFSRGQSMHSVLCLTIYSFCQSHSTATYCSYFIERSRKRPSEPHEYKVNASGKLTRITPHVKTALEAENMSRGRTKVVRSCTLFHTSRSFTDGRSQILALPSLDPVTMRCSCGCKLIDLMVPACARIVFMMRRCRTSITPAARISHVSDGSRKLALTHLHRRTDFTLLATGEQQLMAWRIHDRVGSTVLVAVERRHQGLVWRYQQIPEANVVVIARDSCRTDEASSIEECKVHCSFVVTL